MMIFFPNNNDQMYMHTFRGYQILSIYRLARKPSIWLAKEQISSFHNKFNIQMFAFALQNVNL